MSLLETLTREIILRENIGDRAYFEARLATHMAMRQSSGAIIDRAQFLKETKAGGVREILNFGAITLHGKSRASVSFQVRSGERKLDNLIVFIRQDEAPEGWALLAWVNEPL